MCRNIKPLFNFEPPATEAEIRLAALQFVRKVTGMNAPGGANEAAFERAVDDVSTTVGRLFAELSTTAAPKNREIEAAKARARSAARFARPA
jgi:hypothetical protein